MNDNIVQGCYLQYLLSKYISKSCCDSKVQELETRYNTIEVKNFLCFWRKICQNFIALKRIISKFTFSKAFVKDNYGILR